MQALRSEHGLDNLSLLLRGSTNRVIDTLHDLRDERGEGTHLNLVSNDGQKTWQHPT